MKRVVILNNYPFEQTQVEVLQKLKPDHHLYGINRFHQRGYEVEIVPFQSSKYLLQINNYLKKGFPIPLGNLDQEWSTLQRLNRADLIYSPCQTENHLLSYLRAIGVISTPIICIAHHPLNRGRLSWLRRPFIKLWVKGTDAFPSLSSKLSITINQVAGSSSKSIPLAWGPDASYYPLSPTLGRGVIAAGRTGRDFRTFGLAASLTKVPAHIICLESSVTPSFQTFGQTVKITTRPDKSPMQYPELIEAYSKARTIAIPMHAGGSLCGLTSLTDALAMGKPVIMTRNELIDIDVEKEGIGRWVEPYDVKAWKQAIQFFEDNEDEAFSMGKRARTLMETKFNSEIFSNQVMDIFDNVLISSLIRKQ